MTEPSVTASVNVVVTGRRSGGLAPAPERASVEVSIGTHGFVADDAQQVVDEVMNEARMLAADLLGDMAAHELERMEVNDHAYDQRRAGGSEDAGPQQGEPAPPAEEGDQARD